MLDGLEKNTEYSIDIIASMGLGYFDRMQEIKQATTSSNFLYQSDVSLQYVDNLNITVFELKKGDRKGVTNFKLEKKDYR